MLHISALTSELDPAPFFAMGGGKPDDGKPEEEQGAGEEPVHGDDSGEGGEGSD